MVKHHLVSGIHKSTTRFGGPICFIRAGLTDTDQLMEAISVPLLARYMVYEKEIAYTLCEIATKKNGRLAKAIYVTDAHRVSLFSNNSKFFNAMGDSSKVSENIHPQLVERQVT